MLLADDGIGPTTGEGAIATLAAVGRGRGEPELLRALDGVRRVRSLGAYDELLDMQGPGSTRGVSAGARAVAPPSLRVYAASMTDRPTRPRRDAVLPPIRVTEAQRERWVAAARRAGLSLSAWLRGLADAAAGPASATGPAKKNKAPT